MTGNELREHREYVGLSQAKLSELCGIPQHLLSAFELDKAALSESVLRSISEYLSNTGAVSSLVKRAKRYRLHEYHRVPKMQDRIERASHTEGNAGYKGVLDEIWRSHNQRGPRRFSALSLFSGCGGFSLGFSAAGFNVKGFLEINDGIRSIYRLNFPNSSVMGGDITLLDREFLLKQAEILGDVDAIIGGPPCQGFSLSGKRSVSDPRNSLFRQYMRFVDIWKPKVAVLENVKLLTSMRNPNGGLVMEDIYTSFSEHGYKVKHFEVNAKNYGLPQHRERVLFIATRGDLQFSPGLPSPSHGEYRGMFSEELPYRTFGDACSDLPFLESGETSDDPLHVAVRHPSHVIDWLWDVPEGCSAHDNIDQSRRPPSGYNTTYKRQVWGEPAATVQTTFGMISGCRNVHPIATRSLTIREAARIQSFPDEFKFTGNAGIVRTAIGNAVPPLLAYQVGLHVGRQLQIL